MTPKQEIALRLIFERAGERRGSAHVDVTGMNRHILVSLILAGYLAINADNTVTLTGRGIAAVINIRRFLGSQGRHLPAFSLPWLGN